MSLPDLFVMLNSEDVLRFDKSMPFWDLQIVVDDRSFYVHRFILHMSSEFFKTKFAWKPSDGPQTIYINEYNPDMLEQRIRISPDLFEQMLRIVYTGGQYKGDPNVATCLQVLLAADYFGIGVRDEMVVLMAAVAKLPRQGEVDSKHRLLLYTLAKNLLSPGHEEVFPTILDTFLGETDDDLITSFFDQCTINFNIINFTNQKGPIRFLAEYVTRYGKDDFFWRKFDWENDEDVLYCNDTSPFSDMLIMNNALYVHVHQHLFKKFFHWDDARVGEVWGDHTIYNVNDQDLDEQEKPYDDVETDAFRSLIAWVYQGMKRSYHFESLEIYFRVLSIAANLRIRLEICDYNCTDHVEFMTQFDRITDIRTMLRALDWFFYFMLNPHLGHSVELGLFRLGYIYNKNTPQVVIDDIIKRLSGDVFRETRDSIQSSDFWKQYGQGKRLKSSGDA